MTVSRRARGGVSRQFALPPRWRKLLLTVHVAVSVGWLGAAYLMLVLGIVATHSSPQQRHDRYELLHIFDQTAMIPMSLATLITGVVISVGTQWGLLRFYWVMTKLMTTVAGMIFAGLYVSRMAVHAAELTASNIHANLSAVDWQIRIGAIIMVTMLTVNTTLSIFKPWGRTSRGRIATASRR